MIDNKRHNMREKGPRNNFCVLCESYAFAVVSTVEIGDILFLINEYIKIYDYLKFDFFKQTCYDCVRQEQQNYGYSRYDRYKNKNHKYSHINIFRKYFNVIIETYNRS